MMDVRSSRDQLVSIPLAQKLRDVKKNVSDVKEAAQGILEARSGRQRVSAVARLLNTVSNGEPARIVARLLICAYYINIVYSKVEAWHHLHTPEAQARMRRWADESPPSQLPFPYLYALGLLPVAVLAAAQVVLPWLFSGMLLLFTVLSDVWITWGHLRNFIAHTGQPSELLVKQLALIGCAALLLAYSVKGEPRLRRATAGLLHVDDAASQRPRHSRRRSSVLLLCRLLLGLMLLVLGYHQVLRIKARMAQARFAAASGSPPPPHHFGRQDARDNSWLLLECALATPLALGICTSGVTRVLFVVLLTESVVQWGWWGSGWPSWQYRAHVRDHFFVNCAVAGGVLLMQSFGAGVFTVDSLLAKQE